MSASMLEQVIHSVLYEGYILYPYRPNAVKNCRERFTFGRVCPRDCGDAGAALIQTECLAVPAGPDASVEIRVRFLQPMAREIGLLRIPLTDWRPEKTLPAFEIVPELRVDERLFQTWHEAVEREINAAAISIKPDQNYSVEMPFQFQGSRALEPIQDQQRQVIGFIRRTLESIKGTVAIQIQSLNHDSLHRITVRITNETPAPAVEPDSEEPVLMRTLASAHTVLQARNAIFPSMTDPPAECAAEARACSNIGTWPVLVGDEQKQQRDTMLSSPIILYDYPRIAPESPGIFFDGTEIDEMLALRILTMTEEEKNEMRHVDEQARKLLERTETLGGKEWLSLHGVSRPVPATKTHALREDSQAHAASANAATIHAGDRVRIRPKARADIFDIALSGNIALVEAVERDAENRIHVAVVLEDDPGRDLGLLRQPGHRFFYALDEVEPVGKEA